MNRRLIPAQDVHRSNLAAIVTEMQAFLDSFGAEHNTATDKYVTELLAERARHARLTAQALERECLKRLAVMGSVTKS